MPQGQRRLAAIMFTDMVGYTALGQRNESLSLALVEEQRKLTRPVLSKHGGREVKTIGDAFLVEFPNAVDAVRCAYDIQRTTREFNLSLDPDKRIHLRVGLHLGEVIEHQGDISGDAVNVASRIEPLAEDGGVCLTRQVYDHVQNKVDLHLTSLGPKDLKNVTQSVEVYKMEMPWAEAPWPSLSKPDKRRIAVLPFASLSADTADDYFADGITDELISTISKVRELRVIARTSAMKYKGSGKGISEIGRDLRVGTILEGTVRKAGSRLRITAQLVDPQTEEDLWTESYDRELEDAFAIQSEIARSVAEALRIQLRVVEKSDIERGATGNSEAYTLYLKGRYYWNERTKEAVDKAVKYFEQAAKLDSRYALAFAGLADCHVIYGDYNWMRPKEAFPKAREYALSAIEIDSRLAEPHISLGAVYNSYEGLWIRSEDEFKKAIELRPSNATAQIWYALLLSAMERFEDAYRWLERAGEFDPLSRLVRVNEGNVLIYMGRAEDAIAKLNELVRDEPNYSAAHVTLGWAFCLNSQTEEAIAELKKAASLSEGDLATKSELACLLGAAGRLKEANSLAPEILEPSPPQWITAMNRARVSFALQRVDEAFGYLESALEERSVFINHGSVLLDLKVLPFFGKAREDPRWEAFLRRSGVPGS